MVGGAVLDIPQLALSYQPALDVPDTCIDFPRPPGEANPVSSTRPPADRSSRNPGPERLLRSSAHHLAQEVGHPVDLLRHRRIGDLVRRLAHDVTHCVHLLPCPRGWASMLRCATPPGTAGPRIQGVAFDVDDVGHSGRSLCDNLSCSSSRSARRTARTTGGAACCLPDRRACSVWSHELLPARGADVGRSRSTATSSCVCGDCSGSRLTSAR